jgi:hypothetical protein
MTARTIQTTIVALPKKCDGWRVLPGAFSPEQHWVPLMHRDRQIGMAGIHGVGELVLGELRFDDMTGLPPGTFPLTLPDDPKAAAARVRGRFKVNPLERDERAGTITRAEMLWLEAWDRSEMSAARAIDTLIGDQEDR